MAPDDHRADHDVSLLSHPSHSPILEQLEPRLLLSTDTFASVADASIFEGSPSSNMGSDAIAYTGFQSDWEWAAYFEFDLSSLDSVDVTWAAVQLRCAEWQGDNTLYPEVYEVTESWSEGAITWNNQPSNGSDDYGDPGINGTGLYELSSDDTDSFLDLVQSWVDDPGSNHGVVFRHDPYGGIRRAGLRTHEWGTSSERPKLIVTYTLPDTTPPSPDPSQWLQEPFAASTTSIQMSADPSVDASLSVKYFFDFVEGSGGHDSGWIGNVYTDTDLEPNTSYGYRVLTQTTARAQHLRSA